ncbi:MAG: hypothetical protein KF689_01135 [Gemmatimonadaceae bacterium]|nr:hypothetical protein [Gemmatimonadaceae bacterium]MCW5826534.1 hypothetical protein [Gemmatimonadaceae bacterium]
MQSGQAPSAPPVPPLPQSPGAATGATATQQPNVNLGIDAQANAEQAIRNAVQAAQNAVEASQAVVGQPQVVRVNPDIPPEVVPIVGIVFGSLALMVILTPIVRGIMRMIEKRQDRSLVRGAEVSHQLHQLQQSVDALAIEVERISESQRFQARLAAEREKSALPSGRDGA